MARLPQPGGDDNSWGTILNQFLSESLSTSGALKPGTVGTDQIQDGVVSASKLNAPGASDGKALTYTSGNLAWTDKEPALAAGTSAQYLRGDKSWQSLNKAAIGLTNVDNTADTAKPLSTAASSALDGKASFVIVATGAEARPSGPFCIWAGGNVQPTNMGANDLWFAAAVPADNTPPSVPTGLVASAIQATSFSVSWTASTGAPTLYQVFVNGVSAGTSSTTTLSILGKTASTAYSVTVQARDAAGNWSAQSAPISVTTAAASSIPEHSVFAAGVPASLSYFNDGGSSLSFGNQFYTVSNTTEPWKIVGGRFYVPAGATNIPGKKLLVSLVIKPADSNNNVPASNINLQTDTIESKSITLNTGWNEVRWNSSYDFSAASASRIFIIGRIYTGTDSSIGTGEYLYANASSSAVQASDGSSLFRAAASESVGWNTLIGYSTLR